MDFKTARGTWRWMGAMNANDENSWSFFFGFYYVLLGDLSCFLYGNFATVCNITFKRLLVLLPNPWGDWGRGFARPSHSGFMGSLNTWRIFWLGMKKFIGIWIVLSILIFYINKMSIFFCGSPLHAFLNL